MKRLLCIWLPNWPIQSVRLREASILNTESAKERAEPQGSRVVDRSAVARDDRGALHDIPSPTLLWADDPRRGRIVAACCRDASMRGVRIGMPLVETTPLLRHSPSPAASQAAELRPAEIRRHDPFMDGEMLKQLAAQIQQAITPRVAIESLDAQPWAGFPRQQPESLLCDVTGVWHLFDGVQGLIDAIENTFADHYAVQLHTRMAIAPNMAAAWALAHFGDHDVEISDEPTAAIASFPIEALRIARDTAITLHRLGVERIDQLLRLPRSGLATRLGKPLVDRISQAIGEIDEPLVTDVTSDALTYAHELEYPTRDLPILLHRMEGLLHQAKAGLARRNLGAIRLLCHLDMAVPPSQHVEVGLFAPSADVAHLHSLIAGRFENLSLRHDVVRLTLSIALTGPLRTVQTSLLSDGAPDSQSMGGTAVSRFVDKLSGRLGRDAVLGVKVHDDPLPENAHQTFPMTGQPIKNRRVESPQGTSGGAIPTRSHPSASRYRSPSATDAMRRPLTILDPPQPLVSLVPQVSNQLPEAFRLRGREIRMVGYWGPERIETRWWSGPTIRRDYYRVETDTGTCWWVYRDITASDASEWFLHGQFT